MIALQNGQWFVATAYSRRGKITILDTFPKAQAATSKGYFSKWQLPKCATS